MNPDSRIVECFPELSEINKNVLQLHAAEVDALARFPVEAINALKDIRVLGFGNHKDLGGMDGNIKEQAQLCRMLSGSCASTAMIVGMHYIKCNALNRWAYNDDFFRDYLVQQAQQQRLIASMTSEEGIGGDLRQSQAAVKLNDDVFVIEKSSPCLSYVNEADDILLTCRASEEAPMSDQRLVLLMTEQMERQIGWHWDAMGMRGTCSHACVIKGQAKSEQILDTPFATIANQGMIPDAHVIWASIWLGIAEEAFRKAKQVSRLQFIKDDSHIPGSSRLVSEMQNAILLLQGQIDSFCVSYMQAQTQEDLKFLRSSAFAVAANSLKLNASQISRDICVLALEVCGIAGYRNDDENSVARHIRDVLSATVMVSNERLVSVNAARLML